MPQVVTVDGVGEITFPDEMSPEQMGDAIKRNFPSTQPAAPEYGPANDPGPTARSLVEQQPDERLPWDVTPQSPEAPSLSEDIGIPTFQMPSVGQAARKFGAEAMKGIGDVGRLGGNFIKNQSRNAGSFASQYQPIGWPARTPEESQSINQGEESAVGSLGQSLNRKASEIADKYDAVSRRVGGGPVLDMIGKVGEAAGTMLPAVPLGAVSPMAAIMGYFPILSFEQTHEAARSAYQQQHPDWTDDQLDDAAFMPALASSAITATVGKVFGPKAGDIVKAASSLSPEAQAAMRAVESKLGVAATEDPVRGILGGIVHRAMESAGMMTKFSVSDQIGQKILQKATFDPNQDMWQATGDVVATALSSPVIGAAMGLPHGVMEAGGKVATGLSRANELQRLQLRRGSPERFNEMEAARARILTDQIMASGSQVDRNLESRGKEIAYGMEGPHTYTPAIRNDRGEVRVAGTTHEEAVDVVGPGQRGWVDEKGNFLTFLDIARREAVERKESNVTTRQEQQNAEPEYQGNPSLVQTNGSDREQQTQVNAQGEGPGVGNQLPGTAGPILNIPAAESAIVDKLKAGGYVADSDFTLQGIKRAIGIPEEKWDDVRIAPMVDAGLVTRTPDGLYRFSDSIVRQASARPIQAAAGKLGDAEGQTFSFHGYEGQLTMDEAGRYVLSSAGRNIELPYTGDAELAQTELQAQPAPRVAPQQPTGLTEDNGVMVAGKKWRFYKNWESSIQVSPPGSPHNFSLNLFDENGKTAMLSGPEADQIVAVKLAYELAKATEREKAKRNIAVVTAEAARTLPNAPLRTMDQILAQHMNDNVDVVDQAVSKGTIASVGSASLKSARSSLENIILELEENGYGNETTGTAHELLRHVDSELAKRTGLPIAPAVEPVPSKPASRPPAEEPPAVEPPAEPPVPVIDQSAVKPAIRTSEIATWASTVADYWNGKAGKYRNTPAGLEPGGASGRAIGGTFKEINERKAARTAKRMADLADRADAGRLTDAEKEEITKAFKRLPKEVRDALNAKAELPAEPPSQPGEPELPPKPPEPKLPEKPREDPLVAELRMNLGVNVEEANLILATRNWSDQLSILERAMARRGLHPKAGEDAHNSRVADALNQAMAWLENKGLTEPHPYKPKAPEPPEAIPTAAKFEVRTPFIVGKDPVHATGYWTVVSASDLKPTKSVQATQERNLDSMDAKQKIADIAQRMQPSDLGNSELASTGAPVITRVMEGGEQATKILAGNTRTEGIKLAYASNSPRIPFYKAFVRAQAEQLGIADRLKGIDDPILVRVATEFRNGTHADFARDSNAQIAREFSPTELAMSDARSIRDNDLLRFLNFSEDGKISRDFLDKLHPLMKSAGALRTKEGEYMPEMAKRAEVALMTLIMADHPEAEWLIRQIVERSDDWGITRQVKGILSQTAGLLRVRASMPELDLSPELAGAFRDYLRYKEARTRGTVRSLEEWLGQHDMFEAARSPESALLLAWLDRSTTIKAVSESLAKYIKAADDEILNRNQIDIFNPNSKRTRTDLLTGALKNERPQEQPSLDVGNDKRRKDESIEPEKPVDSGKPAEPIEPGRRETPPGEIPFEQISAGHRRFASGLIDLEKGGAIDNETRLLLQELFREADGKYLGTLTLKASGQLRRSGMAYYSSRTLAMRKGLVADRDKADPGVLGGWSNPVFAPAVVFLHEFGHLAHQFVLTPEEKRVVNAAFLSLQRKQRLDLFNAVSGHEKLAGYFAKNESEFLAQSFAEYVMSKKVPEERMRPVLKKLYDMFVAAIRRLAGLPPDIRSTMDKLVPIYERMLGGKNSFEGPIGAPPEGSSGYVAPTTEEARKIMDVAGRRQERSPKSRAVEEEARRIGGQVGWLEAKLDPLIPKDVDDPAIVSAAQEMVGHGEIYRTNEFVTGFIDPTDFYKEMERLGNDPIRETFRKEAGMRFKLLRDQMEDVIGKHAAMEKYVTSQPFQNKLERAEGKMEKAHYLEYFQRIFNANVADALVAFRRILEKEANTEGRAEMIMRDIRSAESKAQYSEAVKAAISDIVNTLSDNPEAAQLLHGITSDAGVIKAVIDTYNRLKPEGRPEDVIVKWAAETMAHAQETTQNMVAMEAAKRVEAVRNKYSEMEKFLADEMRARPKQTAKAIVRGVRKYATATEKAMAAWRAIHRDIADTAREYETLDIAATIAKNFLADPMVAQYERDVYGLDRPEGPLIQPRPKEATIYDSPSLEVALPDGTMSKPIRLFGDAKEFQPSFAEANRVADVIFQHLQDNPNDPQADYWRRLAAYFQNVIATSRTMAPTKFSAPFTLGIFSRPFGMLNFFADNLGTREAGRFKVSLVNHNRAVELAKSLLHDNVYHLGNIHMDAAESHGFKGARAPVTWYEEIGNALFASWRNPEGGLKAGDKLNGYVITPADMKALTFDSDVTRKGFKIVQGGAIRGREGVMQPVYFDTSIGDTGVKLAVQSSEITSHTVTRHYSQRSLGVIDNYVRQNAAGKWKVLNSNFWNIVVPHLHDRSNVFFDGPSRFENAYKVLSDEINESGLPSANRNMNWLVDKILEIDGPSLEIPEDTDPRSYVIGSLLEEWDKMMGRLDNLRHLNEGDEDKPVRVETLEQKSSFTKGAKRPVAGYWLYDHGFKDSAGLANFAFSIHGYYYERAALDMERVVKDLEASKDNLQNKMAAAATAAGEANVEAMRNGVVKAQSQRVKAGETFDDWEDIDRKLAVAKRLQELYSKTYSKGGNAADFDLTKVTRILSTGVGSTLMAALNTWRNLSTGIVYLGQFLNGVEGEIYKSYPRAFWRTQMAEAFKYGPSFLLSLAKASTVGVAKGAMQAAKPLFNRQFRTAVTRFLEPALVELSENTVRRIEMQQYLRDRGYAETTNTFDDVLAKYRLPTEGGMVREKPAFESAFGRLAYGFLTLAEAPIVTGVGKAITPKFLGDSPLNHGTITASFGVINRLESQLRYLFERYKEAGVKRWDFSKPSDPSNYLTATEVYGKWFGAERTNKNLNLLKNWFEYGPVGFQDAAIRFLAKLEAGVKDAKFLTDDEKWNLADAAVHEVNKGGMMNRPLQFRAQTGFSQIIAPFLGYPTNRARTWIKYFSRAAVEPNMTKSVLWASTLMATIPAALAVGAITNEYTELLYRWFSKLVFGVDRSNRLISERPGVKSKVIGTALAAANMIPFVDAIANTMLNDIPSRARSQPTLFIQNKLMDVLHYIGGVAQTGDWAYNLPQLIEGTLPLSAALINRLPGVEGSVEALNAKRLMIRYGDPDLLQKTGGSFGGDNATPLTPIMGQMMNAAMRGDNATFQELYTKAVATATDMGKEDPEKYVAKLFAARNPYDRSFTRKLTDQERSDLLAKMSPAESALIQDVEDKFQSAANSIGAPANFVKQDTGGAGSAGRGGAISGGGGGGSGVSGSAGGVPRGSSGIRGIRGIRTSLRRPGIRSGSALRLRRGPRLASVRGRSPSVISRRGSSRSRMAGRVRLRRG